MLLTAVPDETYCLKTQEHVQANSGGHIFCYRCGMSFGVSKEPKLGTLLDY
jgi:hypothetical protein